MLIASSDKHDHWTTVGVSHNVVEASYLALVDALEYKLYKDEKQSSGAPGTTAVASSGAA